MFVALGVIFLLFSSWLIFSTSEPCADGHSLSYWVSILAPRQFNLLAPQSNPKDSPEQARARAAIAKMGTNTIPYLLSWMDYDSRGSKARNIFLSWTGFLLNRLRYPLANQLDSVQIRTSRALGASFAFGVLGADATNAIPHLQKRAQTPGTVQQYLAIDSLLYIGPPASPAIFNLITNSDNATRAQTFGRIRLLGTNAAPIIPVLVKCLEDPSEEIACCAAQTLRELHLEPAKVIPALVAATRNDRPKLRIVASLALDRCITESPLANRIFLEEVKKAGTPFSMELRRILYAHCPDMLKTRQPAQ